MADSTKAPAKKAATKKAASSAGQSLGEVATAGLAAVPEPEGPAQGAFENTDYTKVTFVGTNYQTLDYTPKIGDEVEFTVKGRIVEVGDRQMKSGFTQHFGKCDVASVVKND